MPSLSDPVTELMARQTGTYEYEYYSAPDQLDTPRVVPEGSSADYAPQELQLSSYPPLPSPLDGITEGVANSNLISPSSTRTYPQAQTHTYPQAQTRTYPQAQTREPSVDKELLDPRILLSNPLSKTYPDES